MPFVDTRFAVPFFAEQPRVRFVEGEIFREGNCGGSAVRFVTPARRNYGTVRFAKPAIFAGRGVRFVRGRFVF
jgi:hypothetical protein